MTRESLEAEPNWQATYYYPKAGTFVCLMRTYFPGHYYWHEVGYDGLFPWGATRSFDPIGNPGFGLRGLAFEAERGISELVAGAPPQVMPPGPMNDTFFRTGEASTHDRTGVTGGRTAVP